MTAFKTGLLFSIAATLVAGCAAPDPGTRYKDDRLMPPPPVSTPEPAGPPAVFGRFRVTRDGEESKINTFQWTGGLYCSALVHSEADNKGIVRLSEFRKKAKAESEKDPKDADKDGNAKDGKEAQKDRFKELQAAFTGEGINVLADLITLGSGPKSAHNDQPHAPN